MVLLRHGDTTRVAGHRARWQPGPASVIRLHPAGGRPPARLSRPTQAGPGGGGLASRGQREGGTAPGTEAGHGPWPGRADGRRDRRQQGHRTRGGDRPGEAIVDAHPGDPRGALHAWAVAFTEDGQVDEYRGCTFVNAAAEYGEPGHPVRQMAIAQRRWINGITETLLAQAGHPEPQAAARALLALRTGYVFSTGLEEDAGWAGQFLTAHDRIVDGP